MNRFLPLLMGMVLLSGCNMSYLQKIPYISTLWTGQAEEGSSSMPAAMKSVALPVVETAPASPAPAVTVPPVDTSAPAAKEVPAQVPAPAAPKLSPVVENFVSRIRPVSEISPDRSYVNALLTEDTTWSGEISVKGGLTVAPQTTLTVEPGTTVRFGKNAALVVHGRLSVNGTPDRRIRFTSEFAQPEPGDWQGIVLLGSEKNNSIEQCIIEAADIGLSAAFSRITLKGPTIGICRTGARFDDSYATIHNGSFSNCGIGLHARDSELDVRETDISATRQGVVATNSSVAIERGAFTGVAEEALILVDSRIAISGASISGNGTGTVFDRCQGSILGSRIINNRGIGVRSGHSRLRLTGNEIAGNAGVGLHVTEGAIIGWSNIFAGNGGFDLYNGGKTDVTVIGNWWGEGDETEIAARIHGQHRDSAAGPVRFLPLLRARPPIRP